MSDWIEHNGGPQPVAGDVWVRIEDDDPQFSDCVDWSERFFYRILNQNLIDAARLEGIRLGLKAAVGAVRELHDYGIIDRDMALDDAITALFALDPATIARKAVLDQLTGEAQEQNMGYAND